ncbi:MAG: 50S ribosomal protein L25 [Candidatus Rokubacteria bacterium]|nr:50S ribosomal protein L25 [Candidatus Rokubacteria bacterium]
MEIRELSVEPRETRGKGAAKRLRRQGRAPAILYGARSEPLPLSVSPKDIHRVLHAGGSVLVNLRLPGEAEVRAAVVRDLQFDPVDETLLHVDLQAVRMDEEITIEAPIHVVGEAAGVKEQSGILAVLLRTVEVACLPTLIPDRIDVDVSPLRIHDVITVADLRLPEGVRVITLPSQAIVTVSPPMAEEVAAPAAAPAAEPEVLTERKAEEGPEEGKAEAKAKEESKPKKEK